MAGKTNELVGWVEETSKLYDAREYDAVVSSGEQVTAGLLAIDAAGHRMCPARSWLGWQVPLKTEPCAHASARIEEIGTDADQHQVGRGHEGRPLSRASRGSITRGPGDHAGTWRVGHHRCGLRRRLWGPSAVISIRTWTGSTRPTPGSRRRRASSTRSRSRRCWNSPHWAPRCCKPARSRLAMRYKVKLRVLSSFEDNGSSTAARERWCVRRGGYHGKQCGRGRRLQPGRSQDDPSVGR